ncbi:hypothetical protein HU200_015721 [Digitaria exilis]|uniref:F-box domain-containing protein n=1 Tax=Digitaria exilis TaxID=1010633 RepID=A0A835F8Q9_9POAL|nr:hypothetical protein HU200_015721 [Digitaria exilis]
MGRRRPCTSKKARNKAGDDSTGDRITALPLDLRARIASLLNYWQVVQLSVLSQAWRHIHHHTPVVKINLYDFYLGEPDPVLGLLDEPSILSVRVALGRRAQDASASRVDTLRLAYLVDDRRLRRHADRIVGLTDARYIRIRAPFLEEPVRDAWTLDLPPSARDLEVIARHHPAPAIAGPGAAALRKLDLDWMVIREWPHLPSLRFLSLDKVTIKASFAPGAWCPLLEELDISCSRIEHARVDICLPFLRFMDLDGLDVNPDGRCQVPPFGEITIDAPELLELDVNCGAPGSTADYKSFTLRAPRLHFLFWCNQFAERVAIDVGRPGSVKVGAIVLTTVYTRELKDYQEQMMRMLEGLLPGVPPESIADVSKPFITLEECDDSDDDDEDDKVEKLTCDIMALMSRGI